MEELYLGLIVGLIMGTFKMMSNPKGLVVNSAILYVLLGLRIGYGFSSFIRMFAMLAVSFFISQNQRAQQSLTRLLGASQFLKNEHIGAFMDNVKESIDSKLPVAKQLFDKALDYLN